MEQFVSLIRLSPIRTTTPDGENGQVNGEKKVSERSRSDIWKSEYVLTRWGDEPGRLQDCAAKSQFSGPVTLLALPPPPRQYPGIGSSWRVSRISPANLILILEQPGSGLRASGPSNHVFERGKNT
ncbi:hypothetical protein IFR05_015652 [Cadophora sp. M221]|nr:hypothetical protein IFR05_015652 [Cadophora sp. M221]